MPFHRLSSASYLGAPLGTHDFLNDPSANGDPGSPANTDTTKKGSGPNQGTYFIAFGEDGTSNNGNRSHHALGENTDFLDDVVSGEIPVPTEIDGTASGAVSSITLTDTMFVGKSGTANNQDERDRLVSVLDSSSNNEVIDSTGQKVTCSAILDVPAGSNVIGVPASGFQTAPTLEFTPAIPNGTTYRLVYGKKSTLVDVVPNKVDLDALVRLGVRSAHEVPAETLRFIREASRRVGGSVAALAASVFETPGDGDNILGVSNSMTMDVDPTAAIAFNGVFNVRFNRNSGPRILFTVIEGSAGSDKSMIANPAERLAFGDINTLGSGFTDTFARLSSGVAADGDDALRLLEIDPGTVGEPASILKRLNARWTVVVGDGTSTFGDFNGASAVSDVVAAALANGVSDLRIQLKEGQYDVNNLALGGSLTSIKIEGLSHQGCALNNTASAANPGISLPQNLLASFKYIEFIGGSGGSTVDVSCEDASLQMEDCEVANCLEYKSTAGTFNNRSTTLYVARTVFITKDTPPVLFTVQSLATTSYGFIFEDCLFKPAVGVGNIPAFKIRSEVLNGTSSFIDGILFNRCRFYLTDTAESAGDMTGNSGLLEVEFPTPGGTAFNGLTVGSLEWRDCDVSIVGVNDSKILLFLQSFRTTDSSYVTFNKITIDGGRWELPDTDTALTPFYIGADDDSDLFSTFLKEVVIQNLVWGWPSTASPRDYGSQHAVVSNLAARESAGFAIVAQNIRMSNVTWERTSTECTEGDLLVSGGAVQLDTLLFPTTMGNGGGGLNPLNRVRIRAGAGDNWIRNTEIRCGFTGGATTSVWNLLSSGPLLVENCSAEAFSGGFVHGFYVPSGTAANGKTSELQFVRCRSTGNSGSGFHYSHDGVQIDGWADGVFDRCNFSSNSTNGLTITGTTSGTPVAPGTTQIVNCIFDDNDADGLQYSPGVAGGDQIILTGNSFKANNGGDANTQVMFGSATAINGDLLSGTLIGNDCKGTGKIRFYGAASGASLMIGSETRYDENGDGTWITTAYRGWLNGQGMFHNRALYEQP